MKVCQEMYLDMLSIFKRGLSSSLVLSYAATVTCKMEILNLETSESCYSAAADRWGRTVVCFICFCGRI